MSDESELAQKISSETPWWATAPIWLAAGIVGVPSLIALAATYFVATTVTSKLKLLQTYDLSELHQLNQLSNDHRNQGRDGDLRWDAVRHFMEDDLKAQYQTCIHSSRTPQEQQRCISAKEREERYGLK